MGNWLTDIAAKDQCVSAIEASADVMYHPLHVVYGQQHSGKCTGAS